jgi:hypothetical protein
MSFVSHMSKITTNLVVLAAILPLATLCAAAGQASFSGINIEGNRHMGNEAGSRIDDCCFNFGELDKLARWYAPVRVPQFNFANASAKFFIPRNTNYMAAVWFSSGKGKPALLCEFDFNGKLVSNSVVHATSEGEALPSIVLGIDPSLASGTPHSLDGLLTPDRIDALVRAFVVERKINFDFSGVRFSSMSIPKSRVYLADLSYRCDWGKPALHCKVNWDGGILEYHFGKAAPDQRE